MKISPLFILPVLLLWNIVSPALAEETATVAYWRFEPADPLADSGGNDHKLTKNGMAETIARPEQGAGAFPAEVPRTGETNDGIGDLSDDVDRLVDSFQVAPDAKLDLGSGAFTVEALVSPDAENEFQGAVSLGETVETMVWRLFINTKSKQMGMNFFDEGGEVITKNHNPLPGFFGGSNYYIAAVVEPGAANGGQDGKVTFYYKDISLDSRLLSSSAEIPRLKEMRSGMTPLTIGGTIEGNQPDFVDEVRISKGALEESDLLIEK